MSLDHAPDESVIQELKRRRVIRVVVAYAALCLGGLTMGDLILDVLGGPDWGFRALLGAAALGFPVTVVLAWTYDVTPQGIVRTPEDPPAEPAGDPAPEWLWAAVVAVGLLMAVMSWVMRSNLL